MLPKCSCNFPKGKLQSKENYMDVVLTSINLNLSLKTNNTGNRMLPKCSCNFPKGKLQSKENYMDVVLTSINLSLSRGIDEPKSTLTV